LKLRTEYYKMYKMKELHSIPTRMYTGNGIVFGASVAQTVGSKQQSQKWS